MIISHKNEFIFIKVRKTASTSIEFALSKVCGQKDVLTPLDKKEEDVRRAKKGYKSAQNYRLSVLNFSPKHLAKHICAGRGLEYSTHCPAEFVKKMVSNDTWNSYFTFCFVRNPWDKFVSLYDYERNSLERELPPINDFVDTIYAGTFSDYNTYTINQQIVVDKVFKYEDLQKAMSIIEEKLDVSSGIELPEMKSNVREHSRDYQKVLTRESIEKIKRLFAFEVINFNYDP